MTKGDLGTEPIIQTSVVLGAIICTFRVIVMGRQILQSYRVRILQFSSSALVKCSPILRPTLILVKVRHLVRLTNHVSLILHATNHILVVNLLHVPIRGIYSSLVYDARDALHLVGKFEASA